MKHISTIKKYILLVGFCAVALLLPAIVSAEVIQSYDTDIQIQEDSTLEITETIQYDFEDQERHGIFRDIPVSYQTDMGNRRIFVDVSAVRQDGEAAQYQTSHENGNLSIRIGDPNATITGRHSYEISYQVRGALNYFEDDTAELYWDVVGGSWEVPINSASASISLADSGQAESDELEIRCFAGNVGATSSCAQLEKTEDPLGLTAAAENLSPGQAMTVVLNFPDSLVEEPGGLTSILWWLQANPLVLWPLIVLLVGFYIWYRWGKDPEGRGTIVTQYEPPENLKPILVGALIDETVHTRDITSGIIYLAEQGFIEIEREEKEWFLGSHDYVIRQSRSIDEIKDETYKHLAQVLFSSGGAGSISQAFSALTGGDTKEESYEDSVRLSDLKESRTFQRSIKSLKEDVKQDMRDRGWFAEQNNKAALSLVGMIILTMALLFILGSSLTGISVLSGFAAIVIAIIFLMLMKKKTKEGAILQEKLEGFKNFLSMTQKERLDFHNAPERKPKEFMEYLPYAIALGVEEKWAEQFAGMDIPEPSWYHGQGAFAASDFASDLSSFSDSYSQAASGSSGTSGGSAGGGMGGGGGGSW